MDSAMSSPITQLAAPAAAGYIGTRPGGSGGVSSALNTSQYLMRQAADQRVREMFDEMGNYEEPSQDVTAAGAGQTPREASRVADYMDMMNKSVAAGGLAAFPAATRGMTSMHNTLTRYEQPREVSAGSSLMDSGGGVLGTAPQTVIDEGNIIQGGEVTGMAPAQAAELQEAGRYNDARIQELGARTDLGGERSLTEQSKRSLNAARVSKLVTETQDIINGVETGGRNKEGLSLQLDRVNEALNDATLIEGGEHEKKLLVLRGHLIDRMNAQFQADEATKGDSTEEGSGTTVAEGETVASHERTGLKTSPTGQVWNYVNGALRPG